MAKIYLCGHTPGQALQQEILGCCSPAGREVRRTRGTRASAETTPDNGRAWKYLIFTKGENRRDNEEMFWKPTPLLLVVLHILPSAVKISYFIFARPWPQEFHEQGTIGSVYSATIKSLFHSGLQVAEPSGPYLHSKTLSVTQKMIASPGQTNVTSE